MVKAEIPDVVYRSNFYIQKWNYILTLNLDNSLRSVSERKQVCMLPKKKKQEKRIG